MPDRILRIRSEDARDLCTITDEATYIGAASMAEAALVIHRLADHIRGVHSEAQRTSPGGLAAKVKRLERELEERGA